MLFQLTLFFFVWGSFISLLLFQTTASKETPRCDGQGGRRRAVLGRGRRRAEQLRPADVLVPGSVAASALPARNAWAGLAWPGLGIFIGCLIICCYLIISSIFSLIVGLPCDSAPRHGRGVQSSTRRGWICSRTRCEPLGSAFWPASVGIRIFSRSVQSRCLNLNPSASAWLRFQEGVPWGDDVRKGVASLVPRKSSPRQQTGRRVRSSLCHRLSHGGGSAAPLWGCPRYLWAHPCRQRVRWASVGRCWATEMGNGRRLWSGSGGPGPAGHDASHRDRRR